MSARPDTSSIRAGPWLDHIHDVLRGWTAPLQQVAALVPPNGYVMELGCGQGLLVEMIAERASHVAGVDFDSRKCEMARDRLGGLDNVEIVESDIESYLESAGTATADSIVLSDTLSSLPTDVQERVLIQAVRCLRPRGLLLLKIVDTTPRWKACTASLLSFMIYRLIRASVTQDDRIYRMPHSYYDAILGANRMRTNIMALHVTSRSIIPHVAILGWKDSAAGTKVDGS